MLKAMKPLLVGLFLAGLLAQPAQAAETDPAAALRVQERVRAESAARDGTGAMNRERARLEHAGRYAAGAGSADGRRMQQERTRTRARIDGGRR